MTESEKPTDVADRRRAPAGTCLIAAGGLVCLLATFEAVGGLPFDMPRSWYLNRPLWIGLGIAALAAGFLIQRPPKGDEHDTT